MIYSIEITESDISIDEKYIAVILSQEIENSPRVVYDVAVGNNKRKLQLWANNIVSNEQESK